jgi:thiamine biosynthesis lipoprotein
MTAAALDWALWSTSARLVVTDQRRLAAARAVCDRVLVRVDRAANRFDPTSEISRLPEDGRPTEVSPLLAELVREACDAAEWTCGAVDPTVGRALLDLGYDRDIELLARDGVPARAVVRPVAGWRRIELRRTTLRLPPGVRLDLGATAKASAADRCATAVAETLGVGVLVSLGGDVATAGPAPEGGWQVRVQDGPGEPASQVALPAGAGLATSSTLHRRWQQGGAERHHIIDPATGQPVRTPWRTVSVVADTCLTANVVSTALLVRGHDLVASFSGPTRIVDATGVEHVLHGWPVPVPA